MNSPFIPSTFGITTCACTNPKYRKPKLESGIVADYNQNFPPLVTNKSPPHIQRSIRPDKAVLSFIFCTGCMGSSQDGSWRIYVLMIAMNGPARTKVKYIEKHDRQMTDFSSSKLVSEPNIKHNSFSLFFFSFFFFAFANV